MSESAVQAKGNSPWMAFGMDARIPISALVKPRRRKYRLR